MLRCKHKKSRAGCLECKRRHIRCDEGKPLCTNCITADRRCEYRKACTPDSGSVSTLPSVATLINPTVSGAPQSVQGDHEAVGVKVNMHHMELLVHFSLSIYLPELDGDESLTKLVLQAALNAPYLMHEILALSARHLSAIRPDRSEWYLQQAVELQTKAIALFNNASRDEDQDSRVAKLLFSSILGRHILVDVLVHRGLDFADFLSRLIQGIRLHRGTRAVAAAHGWASLLKSEIGPLMAKSIDLLEFKDPPQLSPRLGCLISQSTRLDIDAKAACDTALRMIEAALHDLATTERRSYGLRMIFIWPILLSENFIHLLEQQVPEAIAILGRYALLLHSGKFLWQVRDAGAYLLDLVSRFLGPGWQLWFC
ncbi:hypothetical protein NM208_g1833 [Fusarium decemcellulare]|uniref:Uncharacterized protein n=2 Tax=Fusarium decemcellulare TaxID=57161 RepID=A0ACC1SPU3_9HYPO|nr:hypothetical protein NM208_g3215 [Fusarium decemcellulare]KAJ3546778.1 hypothetical protein NM208_g1833 [Fusarium decemcellulare]